MEETTLKMLGDKLRGNVFVVGAALPKHIRRLMVELARRERLKTGSDRVSVGHEE
jgi:hypothetical protein